jgi:hypothetical protein
VTGPLFKFVEEGVSDPLHVEEHRRRKQSRANETDHEDKNEDRSAPYRRRRMEGNMFVHRRLPPEPEIFTAE